MISLIIPPKDQISRVAKMLADEFGTASNIKSRVNRLSVLGAITSVQQRLKLYNKVPPNGLVVYCGTIVTEEGKEKKVNIDFEPFKPINTSLYLCDNKFHTEALTALLSDDSKFGFIVIDGSGALFGTLQGNTREVLHKFTVDLPKKHGRGGQSALRFARLRMEKRHNYVRKVAETAVQLFISGDKVNVAGLVLAGSADFKTELSQSDMFDQRLQSKVLKLVDISYGGENGFNQAIELSTEVLSNVKFIQEKKLIGRYFDEISQDTGKYCFGVEDTLKALEMGAVEILIVYENLDIMRYVLHCQGTEEEKILYLTPEQEKDKSHFTDKETGQEHELIESMPLLEWFANNYKKFGATLEIVTDKSQEGSQFVKGFGGIGGKLQEEDVFVLFIGWFDNLVPAQVGLILFLLVMKAVQQTVVFTRVDSFPVQLDVGPCWALSLYSYVPQSLCPWRAQGWAGSPCSCWSSGRPCASGPVCAQGFGGSPSPVPEALRAPAHLSEPPCTLLPHLLLLF
uniref:Eukaryotic peptide chain release factor subunit 1 n=1 Tax=Cyanistes caeruleus TaxID=156563 RepID=A0A8C0ZEC7_CYACU